MLFEPTIAMKKGEQTIHQCNNCGLVAIVPSGSTAHRRLAGCPSCDKTGWHKVALPICGLSEDPSDEV